MILAPCLAPIELSEFALPGTKDTVSSFCDELSIYQSNLNMIKLNFFFAPNKAMFQGQKPNTCQSFQSWSSLEPKLYAFDTFLNSLKQNQKY